jgi:hypothetical protein
VKYSATTHKHLPVPRAVKLKQPSVELSDTLKYQLWIMLSADFTFRKTGDIYAAFNKERKIARVKKLLDAANVRYSSQEEAGGRTNFFIHRGHNLGWAEKKLPWGIITREDREILLRELILWDGNVVKGRNQAEFSSVLKHNADIFFVLFPEYWA